MKRWVFYPLLIPLLVILATYTQNADKIGPADILLPAVVATSGAAVFWVVLWFSLRRNTYLSAIITACLTLLFSAWHISGFPWILLAACLLLLAICWVCSRKGGKIYFTTGLNVLCLAMIMVGLPGIMQHSAAQDVNDGEPNSAGITVASLPDIYYILPDEYGSQEVWDEYYSIDIGSFVDYLSGAGFTVLHNYRSNYMNTPASVASTFNMRYLNEDEVNDGGGLGLLKLADNNAIFGIMHALGYTTIEIGSGWNVTTDSPYVDMCRTYSQTPDFSRLLLRQSALNSFMAPALSEETFRRDTIRYQLATLKEIPDLDFPTFTFCHILLPHGPAIFNADGSIISIDESWDRSRIDNYRNSVTYISNELKLVVEAIQSKSSNAVIIIQADTGPLPHLYYQYKNGHDGSFANVANEDPDIVRERFGILGAFYTPRFRGSLDIHSSVNSFRALLNGYFGTSYAMLPDRQYFHSVQGFPRTFVDVTCAFDDEP